MENTIERVGNVVVITVQIESLDAKSANAFREEFHAAADADSQVLLDLNKVDFIDSSGLGAIVAELKHLRESSGDLKICEVKKSVNVLFELVHMNKLVEIYNQREEALASFV